MIKSLIFCCTLFIPLSLFGQQETKFEKERRVKQKEIPAAMLELLTPYIESVKKLKYYEESDGKNLSYEAKFIYYKNKVSAEFSADGKLEDIEITRCFTELPQTTQNNIVNYLYPNDDFKITKTQKQFSGGSNDKMLLDNALKNIESNVIRYELIVEVKANGSWLSFEMLFDSQGNFMSSKQLIGRAEDHMLY